jgi:hypothetical protein
VTTSLFSLVLSTSKNVIGQSRIITWIIHKTSLMFLTGCELRQSWLVSNDRGCTQERVTYGRQKGTFLGEFAELRKATASFVIFLLSVCLSARPLVCMEQFGSNWTDFYKFWRFSIFRKSTEKIQISLKYDNNGYSKYNTCTSIVGPNIFVVLL